MPICRKMSNNVYRQIFLSAPMYIEWWTHVGSVMFLSAPYSCNSLRRFSPSAISTRPWCRVSTSLWTSCEYKVGFKLSFRILAYQNSFDFYHHFIRKMGDISNDSAWLKYWEFVRFNWKTISRIELKMT